MPRLNDIKNSRTPPDGPLSPLSSIQSYWVRGLPPKPSTFPDTLLQIQAPPSTFEQDARQELIKQILDDLKPSGKRRLTSKGAPKSPASLQDPNDIEDAAQALLAVKTLGREASGSEVIAEPESLKALLGFQSSLKDYPDAASEALRCIANALLLIDSARTPFLEKGIDGGDICMTMLEVCFTCRDTSSCVSQLVL